VIQFSVAARDLCPSEPPIQWVSAVQRTGPEADRFAEIRNDVISHVSTRRVQGTPSLCYLIVHENGRSC